MTEREIFLAVLDLPDPASRARYLERVCGSDPVRRARIEALLRSHDTAGGFLDSPAVDPPAPGAPAPPDDDALTLLAPPQRPGSLGRIGHYEVLEVLGRGGFGVVFRALDESLQRVVAVKVLAPQLAVASPARKRFLREARSSAKVRHENVVQVYAVEEQPLPYLVMEFIPGETLQERLDRTGPLETVEVVEFGRQIAEGLAAAHATGLIHRDIKPANILIEARSHPRVKITDFGMARAADDASLTQSGIIAGTPMFMAPEQARGEALDHRADLFSLGSVLYTMCSGRPPFRANGTLAVLKRVAEDSPRPIPEIIPEAPPWLCEIIARLHAKKSEDRFASAQEVADLLARGLAEIQGSGRGDPAPTSDDGRGRVSPPLCPTIRRPRFRIRRWAAAAAALLLLVAGLGFTEATGVTDFHGTVIRLFSPEGTLVVEVDDPEVSVKIDGSDLVITGTGAREIRLKPGSYTVEASKDGKVVTRELVAVTKNGRKVVRVSQESPAPDAKAAGASAWERSVAAMSPTEQAKAVGARLKELNPGFDGAVTPIVENSMVTGLAFSTTHVADISPVRALTHVQRLDMRGSGWNGGSLSNLSPLQGMSLTALQLDANKISDLKPLKGMPLLQLDIWAFAGSDLTPLKGMPLRRLNCGGGCQKLDLTPLAGSPLEYLCINITEVSDLAPLKDIPLTELICAHTQVSDLTPLRGMHLQTLSIYSTKVSDLAPVQDMPLKEIQCDFQAPRDARILRAIKTLDKINDVPAALFWKQVEGQTKDP